MQRTKIYSPARPFLKWAGGKGQLLSQLEQNLPKLLASQEFTYIEPFVGGGAMFFHMLQRYPNIKKAVLCDVNPFLVAAYITIRNQSKELVDSLLSIERQYLKLEDEERKPFYLEKRDVFNKGDLDPVYRTTLLIFLNHTCFNGLYRVNAKGEFNVPFGRYVHPTICNKGNIESVSEILNRRNVVFLNADFEQTYQHVDDNGINFFYFDPPYRPLNATSSFNSYAKQEFNDSEQIRLRNFCKKLDNQLGIYWLLSNSDCSAKNPQDLFFEDIYKDYNIRRVYASRSINARPDKRGKLTELLISNYVSVDNSVYVAETIEPYKI